MRLGIVLIRGGRNAPRTLRPRAERTIGPGFLASMALIAVLAASCSSGSPNRGDGKLTVVAGFYPLAEAAHEVGGDLVEIRNLTPPGVEPHDLELTPSEIAAIQSADIVLYLGHGFAPAVEQASAQAGSRAIDLLQRMPLKQGVPEEGQTGPVT